MTPRLAALVRRELIRPETAQFAGEDGFRFRHLLIRDAAYDALPKSSRAELHERFAGWLEQRGDDWSSWTRSSATTSSRPPATSTSSDNPTTTLAERAGERLAAAGRRALWRGDERAAAGLLERALELTRPARLDVVLELDLAEALFRDSPKAAAVADAAAERARAAGDETAEALARVGAAYYRSFFAADPAIDELETLARTALPLLEQAEDHAGLVHVWTALGYRGRELALPLRGLRARVGAGAPPRPAGRPAQLGSLPPRELRSSTGRGRRTRRSARSTRSSPRTRTRDCCWLAPGCSTMLARFDEASPIAREAGQRWRELTGDDWVDFMLGYIAATAGDHESAAVHHRRFCDLLEARGQRCYPLDLRAAARPLALRARPPRRGRAARPARPHPRRDGAGRLHAGTLAAGAGARPREPRPTRRGGDPRPRGRRDHGTHRRAEHRKATRSATSPKCCTPPAEPTKPPPRSPRRSNATNARRTSPRPRRCATAWPSSRTRPPNECSRRTRAAPRARTGVTTENITTPLRSRLAAHRTPAHTESRRRSKWRPGNAVPVTLYGDYG